MMVIGRITSRLLVFPRLRCHSVQNSIQAIQTYTTKPTSSPSTSPQPQPSQTQPQPSSTQPTKPKPELKPKPTSIRSLTSLLTSRQNLLASLPLPETDLIEQFVRGSGPGGQAVNKTSNCVSLIHTPTGVRVVCQESRSLQVNRRLARRLLKEKIDALENPGLSKQDLQAEKERRRKLNRSKKSKKKYGTKVVVVDDEAHGSEGEGEGEGVKDADKGGEGKSGG